MERVDDVEGVRNAGGADSRFVDSGVGLLLTLDGVCNMEEEEEDRGGCCCCCCC